MTFQLHPIPQSPHSNSCRFPSIAPAAGFETVVMDASDLCLGENELDDHERCCNEVAHIRAALQLATQRSRRNMRAIKTDTTQHIFDFRVEDDNSLSDSDDSSDSVSKNSSVIEDNRNEVAKNITGDSFKDTTILNAADIDTIYSAT